MRVSKYDFAAISLCHIPSRIFVINGSMSEGHIANSILLKNSVIRNPSATNLDKHLVNIVCGFLGGVGHHSVAVIEHPWDSILMVSIQDMSWSILSQESKPSINVWGNWL
jgi:hypothetical protein